MNVNTESKCYLCTVCDGNGCISELPGMGGVFENYNFIKNCTDWSVLGLENKAENQNISLPPVRLAPMTGAIQNVGYHDERQFYFDLIDSCIRAGINLSIGDGYPDEKLKFGIEALTKAGRKAAVFIKPYENNRIYERMEWAQDVSEIIGVDIDSYAILTMRNLVNLEEKTAKNLLEIKKKTQVPFAIKGVFRAQDIELIREVHPDIVVVSNHGGRIETDRGSTALFLQKWGKTLSGLCGELWVDGGIRTRGDLEVAQSLGAVEVMIGRPLAIAVLKDKEKGIEHRVAELLAVSKPKKN